MLTEYKLAQQDYPHALEHHLAPHSRNYVDDDISTKSKAKPFVPVKVPFEYYKLAKK